jgi:hypothetical protein
MVRNMRRVSTVWTHTLLATQRVRARLRVAGAARDGGQQALGRRVVAHQHEQRALVAAAEPEAAVRRQVGDVQPALPPLASVNASHGSSEADNRRCMIIPSNV